MAVKVVELPEQILAVPLMLAGAVGAVDTAIATVAQPVVVVQVPDVPIRRTQ